MEEPPHPARKFGLPEEIDQEDLARLQKLEARFRRLTLTAKITPGPDVSERSRNYSKIDQDALEFCYQFTGVMNANDISHTDDDFLSFYDYIAEIFGRTRFEFKKGILPQAFKKIEGMIVALESSLQGKTAILYNFLLGADLEKALKEFDAWMKKNQLTALGFSKDDADLIRAAHDNAPARHFFIFAFGNMKKVNKKKLDGAIIFFYHANEVLTERMKTGKATDRKSVV